MRPCRTSTVALTVGPTNCLLPEPNHIPVQDSDIMTGRDPAVRATSSSHWKKLDF